MKRKIRENKGIVRLLACLAAAVLTMMSAAAPAFGAVSFTKDAAGPSGSVYVAGNPEMYPLEYYNRTSGKYEGLMPMLLEKISQSTGLDFCYIRASASDRRQSLAENGQVDMVSCWTEGDAAWVKGEQLVITFTENGREYKAAMVFTGAASKDASERITAALKAIPKDELASMSVSYVVANSSPVIAHRLLYVLIGLAALIIISIIVISIRMTRFRREKEVDKWIDSSSGVGNKGYFVRRYADVIGDENRVFCYILLLGFDISWVNRCLGKDKAEEMLKKIGSMLPEESKTTCSARVSGGEFALLFDSSTPDEAYKYSKSILRSVNRESEAVCGVNKMFSGGLLPIGSLICDGDHALSYAGEALKIARANSSGVQVCTDEIMLLMDEDEDIMRSIPAAMKNGEFKIFIQPVMNTKNGRFCGGEMLSRWESPERGLIKPSRYMDIILDMDLSADMDFYMFENTCRCLQEFAEKNIGKFALSCNFARSTVCRRDFPRRLEKIASAYEFERSRLVLEITEAALEQDKDSEGRNIKACKEMGFKIAIDDFGTGYTSFEYFNLFPLDILKLDKELITNCNTEKGQKLLESVISLAHSMDCKVVCEGAETQSDVDCIKACGGYLIQGFYYSRPVPESEFLNLIEK